jgi:hypothetical protein
MGQQNKWALDIGLDTLSLGRAAHLAALDAGEGPPTGAKAGRDSDGRTAGDPNAPQGDGHTATALAATAARHLDAAVDGLRAAGSSDHLPRGLLARAAFHRDFPAAIVGSGGLATRDLTEAFEIASAAACGCSWPKPGSRAPASGSPSRRRRRSRSPAPAPRWTRPRR